MLMSHIALHQRRGGFSVSFSGIANIRHSVDKIIHPELALFVSSGSE